MKKKILPALLLLLFSASLNAQHFILDSIRQVNGSLIKEEFNTFAFADSSENFNRFFHKLDSLYNGYPVDIQIFHIGGSHIQADIYPNRVREYLRNITPFTGSARGLIFPYRLVGTNNPANYAITGDRKQWKGERSSRSGDSGLWGLCGISVTLDGDSDTLRISANRKVNVKAPYTFDKIRLFIESDSSGYTVAPSDSLLKFRSLIFNPEKGYCDIEFYDTVSSAGLLISKNDSIDNAFLSLSGMELKNGFHGISYNSIGVNGASFRSYSRCTLFNRQLQLFRPDLFIISIGTNDASTRDFDAERFRSYYDSLISVIQAVNPECAILLTVPNDSYYRKKYPNKNTAIQQQVIHELARKHRQAVWDFYAVMGGLGSSQRWYNRKLMVYDRIHFTLTGYNLKGDLLAVALIGQWERSTGREPESLIRLIKRSDE